MNYFWFLKSVASFCQLLLPSIWLDFALWGRGDKLPPPRPGGDKRVPAGVERPVSNGFRRRSGPPSGTGRIMSKNPRRSSIPPVSHRLPNPAVAVIRINSC